LSVNNNDNFDDNNTNTNKQAQYKYLISSYFDDKENVQQQEHGYSRYSFKETFRKSVSNLVEKFFEVIVFYFDKYSEQEFHDRMLLEDQKRILVDPVTNDKFSLRGFQFVDDFKKHHKLRFAGILWILRRDKGLFKFNEDKMYSICIGLLETKGWKINDMEKESMRQTIRRMKNLIYGNLDTLRQL
jgi:hypothetical protein